MAELDYKPFRFFGTQASYDAKRISGLIDDRTVCLIKDTGKIMHAGVSYCEDLPVLYQYGTQAEYEHNQAVIARTSFYPCIFCRDVGEDRDLYANFLGTAYWVNSQMYIIYALGDIYYIVHMLTSPVQNSAGSLDFFEDITEEQCALTSDLANKQDTLISGENIKTINGESLLGSGDITIGGGGDDLAMPVLREGESSSALYDQLATIAGNDVESVAVQYITADGMMWRGTWYPTLGYLDVHTISGVYRLTFEDVVGGLSDATFIETVTADSVNVGSKSQSTLNVTLDGKALIEISLTTSGNALAFTGSLPAGSSTKIVIKNTSSSSRSFNFSTTSSITSLLSSTSVTVAAYKAVVLELLSNGSSMVLYQLA